MIDIGNIVYIYIEDKLHEIDLASGIYNTDYGRIINLKTKIFT